MRFRRKTWAAAMAFAAACLLFSGRPARAEVLEEVVAKVDDDVITKSDMDDREQAIMAELYRRYTGQELDNETRRARTQLLRRMIDEKVLLHRAQKMFDMDKAGEAYLRWFKEQQKITTDEDLQRLLQQEGMTVAELKKRLIEMSAPDEVTRFEVADRVAIADKDIQAYYDAHPDEFRVPAVATAREIVVLADESNRPAKRQAAEALRERAAAPDADFGAIAKESSEAGTREQGGLLSEVKKGDLAAPLEKAAFELPVGAVSEVIDMPHGFHILKVETRTDERIKPFDEVKESISQKLYAERYNKQLRAFLKKAWDESTVQVVPKYQNRLAPAEE